MSMTAMVSAIVLIASSGPDAIRVNGDEVPDCDPLTDQLVATHFVRFSSNLGWSVLHERAYRQLDEGFDAESTGPGLIYGTVEYGVPECSYLTFRAVHEISFVDPDDLASPGVVNGEIRFQWGDGGGDLDHIVVNAWDPEGSLVSTVRDSSTSYQEISISGSRIHRVEFRPAGARTSDNTIDWIEYPRPTSSDPVSVRSVSWGAVRSGYRER